MPFLISTVGIITVLSPEVVRKNRKALHLKHWLFQLMGGKGSVNSGV